ncbi:uncharacterized protein LOC142239727 [Haematobia irritans]|uniref:uncharacterized protein LOC142239727 n=1 Tax=Haematobia irritans TaxID=7368 RepID=UPI003F4FFAE3
MGGGTYVHYGVKDAITDFLVKTEYNYRTIIIDINIDGLPLCKSSTKQVWPILAGVVNTDEVLLVGTFEGYSKPENSNEFLREFVTELNQLMLDGIRFQEKLYMIKVTSFIMDAPARSFIIGAT